MTQQNSALDPMLVQEVAKYATVITIASYINKVAELAGEIPLTDDQIVAVSLRAGDELPDSIASTMDNPAVTAGIIQKLTDASMELANAAPVTPSVMPADVELVNIGEGEVLQQVAGNPHANTGGIELHPDVKVIETQLMTGKTAGLNPQQIEGEITMAQEKEILAKLAGLETSVKHLISAFTKLAEAGVAIPPAVADDQGNNPGAQPTSTGTEAPAAVEKLTADNTVLTEAENGAPAPSAPNTDVTANPNPDAGKIAKHNQLLGVIKKYAPNAVVLKK